MSDVDEQAAKYIEVDDQLGKDVAYIPLSASRSSTSSVARRSRNYVNNPATRRVPGPRRRRRRELDGLKGRGETAG